MNPLVNAWQDAIDSFRRAVAVIPDDAFARPSLLPGWTVGDIVAHVNALEDELSGQPLPAHEPDWDTLPHADDLFSRYTEIGVDYRRGRSPQELRDELDRVAATRSEQLRTGPQDPDRLIRGVAGLERTFDHQLRMRCFDIFLHELDMRDALGIAEPPLGPAAEVAAQQMAGGLGYIWVKKAGARAGQVLHLVVPGWVDAWIGVGEDGRGGPVGPGVADTELRIEPMDFLRLGSGRRGDPRAASITGDVGMGEAVVAGLNVAP
jgi:uncharacterized protein (TIGR03083 family)